MLNSAKVAPIFLASGDPKVYDCRKKPWLYPTSRSDPSATGLIQITIILLIEFNRPLIANIQAPWRVNKNASPYTPLHLNVNVSNACGYRQVNSL